MFRKGFCPHALHLVCQKKVTWSQRVESPGESDGEGWAPTSRHTGSKRVLKLTPSRMLTFIMAHRGKKADRAKINIQKKATTCV